VILDRITLQKGWVS